MSLVSHDDQSPPNEWPVPSNDGRAVATDTTARPDGGGGRRTRRFVPVVTGVAALGVAAAGAGFWLTGAEDPASSAEQAETIRAVEAVERDLIEYTELDATMGFADVVTATAASDGVLTAVVDEGDVVGRGDVVYEVNAEPVVALWGSTPLYRTMSEGMEGDDVLLLEQNLASLGHHATLDDDDDEVDTGFIADGVFDAATTDAVLRWQAELGRPETGQVGPSDVVVTTGSATVAGVTVGVGDRVQTGAPILDLNVTSTVDAFYSEHTGEVEVVATPGSTIAGGDVVYTVDGEPIVAVVLDPESDVDFDRDLFDGVADGDDVEVLERILADLGYDAGGDLDVDDEFDDATAEAIGDWQDDLADDHDEVAVTGRLDLDDVVVVEPGTVVGAPTDRDSDTVATGAELFVHTVEGGTRIVTTAIEVTDQDRLTEGDVVEVRFPGGEVESGTVTEVARSSQLDPTDPGAEPTLAVEVVLDSVPGSAVDLVELDVEVLLVEEVATGAVTVPVTALVAIGDGDHAVEVVVDGGPDTRFVAVETGMFADGFVAVTGIEAGTAVVVPS